MAKPKPEPVEDPVEEPVETPTEEPAGGPDPEEFLAQIEARAHKGAAEGSKQALDDWVKTAVAEADLDQIDEELQNGQRPGGAGGAGRPAAPGGPARTPAPQASGGSIAQDALALLIGKPRPKPPA